MSTTFRQHGTGQPVGVGKVFVGPPGPVGPRGPAGPPSPRGVTITYPNSVDRVTVFYVPAEGMVVETARAVIVGAGATLDLEVRYSSNRDAPGTLLASAAAVGPGAGKNLTIVAGGVVPAGNYVIVDVTGITGTVEELHLTLNYS